MLPVELWVLLLEPVSPRDRLALALTCRELFLLVNTHASFRDLKLSNLDEASARALCKFSSLLTFAFKIEWMNIPVIGSRGAMINRGHHRREFGIILSSVAQSTTLRHLHLTNFDVTKEHRHIIFSLPNLRTLSLWNAHFTNINSADHSAVPCITEVFLRGLLDSMPTLALLWLLRNSIQTLEVDAFANNRTIFSGLAKLTFPQLTTLTAPSSGASCDVILQYRFWIMPIHPTTPEAYHSVTHESFRI